MSIWVCPVQVCDRACNTADCGFDGGDCGPQQIGSELFGIVLQNDTKSVQVRKSPAFQTPPLICSTRLCFPQLPAGTKAFFVNLTEIFPTRVTEASHDNPGFVRAAVVTQKLHLLTMLLYTFNDREPEAVWNPKACWMLVSLFVSTDRANRDDRVG